MEELVKLPKKVTLKANLFVIIFSKLVQKFGFTELSCM